MFTLLRNTGNFVYTYCLETNPGIEDSNLVLDKNDNIPDDHILLIVIQKYIHLLTSYKHGNRLVKLSDIKTFH